jgi:hypothetical protein
MFNKKYYKLEDAANRLGVDTETILQNAMLVNVFLSIVKQNYGMVLHADMARDAITYENLTNLLVRDMTISNSNVSESLLVYLDSHHQVKILNNQKVFVCSYEKPYLDVEPTKTVLLRGSDSQFRFFYFEEKSREITCDDLVISHNELQRLAAQIHEKPRYEQLQAENEVLKQQLDGLNNSTSQRKQQQREQALSYWIAGKGAELVKPMKQSDIHEELKLIDGLFQIAESTFNDFWQAQKLIELDAGKR